MMLPLNFSKQKNPQLFEKLTEQSLGKLLQHSTVHNYETDTLLVQQGDKPQHIYLVIEGSVKTFRLDEEGHETIFRLLQPGDTCMDAVLFMGGPSPIYVQTLTPSKILMIPERIVKTHVLEDGQFATNLLQIVTKYYKNSMHQIDAMNIKSPIQRVGYYFLLKHLDKGHDSLEFTLPFHKQSIANYLGMTPETFSRTLKKMKELGIDVKGDTIKLRDTYALCLFCDSDTQALCPHYSSEDCQSCVHPQVNYKG